MTHYTKQIYDYDSLFINYDYGTGKPTYYGVFTIREKLSDKPPLYSVQKYRRELTASEYIDAHLSLNSQSNFTQKKL